MKQSISGFLFMILSAGAFAQEKLPADSLYMHSQSLRRIEDATQHAASLLSSGYGKVSTASLSYHLEQGHFRTAQSAESGRGVSFRSNGISTLGRFKVAGFFNFSRTWQDSLAWNLQGVSNSITPYYTAAGKANNFQRQNYNFGGLLTYAMVKDKLYLAAGIDYLFNTATGSIDPRPSVQTFQLRFNPQLLYKSGRHIVGAELQLAYGKESNSVRFSNDAYGGQGNLYPDRINYLVMGAGLIKPIGSIPLKREDNILGFSLNYAYTAEDAYLTAGLNWNRHYEYNFSQLTNSSNITKFGAFTTQNYNGRILAGIKSMNYEHQMQVILQSQTGSDFNYTEYAGSRNYKYSHRNIVFNYTALKKSGSRTESEIGAELIYNSVSKKDGASVVSVLQQYIQPGIHGALYNNFKDRSILAFHLAPSVRLPLSNEIEIDNSTNVFANATLYPDYTYWSSTAGILDFGAKYSSPKLFKNMNSGFGINATYINPLSSGKDYQMSSFTPSKNRVDLTFSFNLYF